ncbi:tripartite tricarboxylate transporter TctB family protein [Rhodobacteraceae bacterium 2376]|uniref:Tripartite tricarboxylate transporter TctB family protein n=1 Tax=Rhabdonatronobacter sediminivivens TaxID=2743469 RepID=A0A7Z0KZX6_9RHOB|nr:tripartite tricarboxylate transporter TctB family protein [Rhabdonatronobacter sediminivivens]NYS26854.1 tripartite tricarboxylate transporter TctB family protein [Rhabdonatronobacter sediminivivens]
MTSFLLRITNATMEYVVCALLLGMGVILFQEALRLGPGWGWSGPEPGFFPFVMTLMMTGGALVTVYLNWRKPDHRPFFEVSQEIVDLVKVATPILGALLILRYAGIYITAGLYIGFFMVWYGKFKWYWGLVGMIALPLVLWAVLTKGFNIPMPMSMFYRTGQLPI